MNPKRKALNRNVSQHLVDRFGFLKYPQTFADYNNEETGIVYGDGVLDDVSIEEVRFFRNGIAVSTGESTDYSAAVFQMVIDTMVEAGAEFRPDMVTRLHFLSQIVVRSEIDLGAVIPGLNDLLTRTFPAGQPTGFSLLSFFVGEVDAATLMIERLAEQPPEVRNLYWSQAPLPTWDHFKFLQEFEGLFL